MYASDETELTDPSPIMSLQPKEGKRRAVFLRYKDRERGEVRVYPGKLQVPEPFCTVPVDESTTITDLIREALVHFNRTDIDCEDFRCSEVLLDRGGKYNFIDKTKQNKTLSKHWFELSKIFGNLIYIFGKFLCSYRYIKFNRPIVALLLFNF